MSKIDFIYQKVEKLIKKFGTRDPFKICDNLNIHIYYKELGDSLKAYFFYQSRIKNIIINSNSEDVVCKILCAHELGHAILHENLAAMIGFKELALFDDLIPTEYEANLFAAELMIPDNDLLRMLKEENKSLFDISSELCVPVELLDFKLRVLKKKGLCLVPPCFATSDFLKKDITGRIL